MSDNTKQNPTQQSSGSKEQQYVPQQTSGTIVQRKGSQQPVGPEYQQNATQQTSGTIAQQKGSQQPMGPEVQREETQKHLEVPKINTVFRIFLLFICIVQILCLKFIFYVSVYAYSAYWIFILPLFMYNLNLISNLVSYVLLAAIGLKKQNLLICGSITAMFLTLIYIVVFFYLMFLGFSTFGIGEALRMMNIMHWILMTILISYLITSIGTFLLYLQVKKRNDWLRKNPMIFVEPETICN